MKKIKKSGIILITTLIFMTLTFMLAVMICKNGKESLFAGNRYAENEQAYLATVSGMEYIKGQLYADKDWEVNAPSKASNKKNGILIEKEGNILTGYLLTSNSGTVSKDNYDSKFEIYSENDENNRQYKSINNLAKPNSIQPFKPTTPNGTINKDGSKREIPPKTFYAYVKGTCGKTVRYAEAMFISNGPKALDGGNIINGKVKITSKSGETYTDGNPFITINNVNDNKNGKITASDELIFSANGTNAPKIILNPQNNINIASNGIKVGNFERKGINKQQLKNMVINNDSDHIIYNLNDLINEDVKKLSYNNENTNITTLPSGTYAYINDKKNPSQSYWAYNQETNYDTVKTLKIKSYTELKNNNLGNITFNGRKINVTGEVSSEGGLNFIVIDKTKKGISTKYTISNSNTIDFSISENGKIGTNNSGNLLIRGEVTGTGKIYSAGDLTINAGSILETQAQSGMAIYAENDINILKTKNLTSNSSNTNLEVEIIKQALNNVPENITLVSSYNETDDEEDDEGNKVPAVVLEENSENSSGANEIASTEIVINGHPYEISGIINNYRTEEDNNTDINVITLTKDSTIYKIKINEDNMEVYNNESLIGTISATNDATKYSGSNGRISITDYNPGNENNSYRNFDDYILKIDNQILGIIDYKRNSSKYPNGTFTYGNKDFFFTTTPYTGTLNLAGFTLTDEGNISSLTGEQQTEEESTSESTKEVTIQEYVENYYKDHIGDTIIKGSMYSKNGNITINGQKKNFYLTGALITANSSPIPNRKVRDKIVGTGNLIITNASHVNLTYDPNYVPFFEEQGILTTTIFESTF